MQTNHFDRMAPERRADIWKEIEDGHRREAFFNTLNSIYWAAVKLLSLAVLFELILFWVKQLI